MDHTLNESHYHAAAKKSNIIPECINKSVICKTWKVIILHDLALVSLSWSTASSFGQFMKEKLERVQKNTNDKMFRNRDLSCKERIKILGLFSFKKGSPRGT